MDDNKDIDSLIAELNHVKSNVDNAELVKKFISDQADRILSFLKELKKSRGKISSDSISLIKDKSHRIVIEGYSNNTIDEAFSDALGKVTPYFSEYHDVSVTVLGLHDLPKGGYRATLEVHVTPMKSKLSDSLEGPEEEVKRINDSNSNEFQSREALYLQSLVHSHFLTHSGYLSHIPDHLLINIHDANTLNMMIEKEFSHVANVNAGDLDIVQSPKVTVRVLQPDESASG